VSVGVWVSKSIVKVSEYEYEGDHTIEGARVAVIVERSGFPDGVENEGENPLPVT
jgi:hypothetical protein